MIGIETFSDAKQACSGLNFDATTNLSDRCDTCDASTKRLTFTVMKLSMTRFILLITGVSGDDADSTFFPKWKKNKVVYCPKK